MIDYDNIFSTEDTKVKGYDYPKSLKYFESTMKDIVDTMNKIFKNNLDKLPADISKVNWKYNEAKSKQYILKSDCDSEIFDISITCKVEPPVNRGKQLLPLEPVMKDVANEIRKSFKRLLNMSNKIHDCKIKIMNFNEFGYDKSTRTNVSHSTSFMIELYPYTKK